MVIQKLPTRLVTKPDTKRLLTAAAIFLCQRNFSDCRTYALRARDSDPTHPAPDRILAITGALSAPPHDYYAVLGLHHFEPDGRRIQSAFETLSSNLNPKFNPYPIAAEALDLVMKAWSVLSIPSEKAAFDDALRRNLSASDAGTFWTNCPYCYRVYEYDAVYVDTCLKCWNEKCARILHAVPIPAPPPEILKEGRYLCEGFLPFGRNGKDIGWGPFRPPAVLSKGSDSGCKEVIFVDTGKRKVKVGVENEEGVVVDKERIEPQSKRRKVEDREEGVVVDTSDKEITDADDGKKRNVEVGVDREMKDSSDESVTWDERHAGYVYGVGEGEAGNSDETTGLEIGFGGGVEFFEGDDDLFVGL